MERKTRNRNAGLVLSILGIVAASILLYVIFTNFTGFFAVIRGAITVIAPLLYGVLFAFLMNPFVCLIDRTLIPYFEKKKLFPKHGKKISRLCGILLAVLVLGLVVYGFFALVLPQLYDTVTNIGKNLGTYYNNAEKWISGVLKNRPELSGYANVMMDKLYNGIERWLNEDLLNNMQSVLTVVTDSVRAVVNGLLNVIIGAIVAVYVLASKERFLEQAKMLTVALFSEKGADRTFALGRKTYTIFSGFLTGKLIDSLIIGILCYIGMRILRLPFAVLVSVIVGVTNIIPFFGPIIGAVPSALLILLESPLQSIYFLIFVVVLQQVDGNIIGPKILGESIGISGFWVLVSITIAGGLFGFAGMVLGVPVFAVLYELLTEWVYGALRRKNLSTEREAYLTIDAVGELNAPPSEEPAEDAPKA